MARAPRHIPMARHVFRDVDGVPLFSTARKGTHRPSCSCNVYGVVMYTDAKIETSIPVQWTRLDPATLEPLEVFNHTIHRGEVWKHVGVIETAEETYIDFFDGHTMNFIRATLET
jgi:hypothetical protein